MDSFPRASPFLPPGKKPSNDILKKCGQLPVLSFLVCLIQCYHQKLGFAGLILFFTDPKGKLMGIVYFH